MDTRQTQVVRISEAFEETLRLFNIAKAPDKFVIIVDCFGDAVFDRPPSKPSLKMRNHRYKVFGEQFHEWLVDQSTRHTNATITEFVAAIRAHENYSGRIPLNGRFALFESIEELADWWSRPEHVHLDAFNGYYIGDGFPIFGMQLWKDR